MQIGDYSAGWWRFPCPDAGLTNNIAYTENNIHKQCWLVQIMPLLLLN